MNEKRITVTQEMREAAKRCDNDCRVCAMYPAMVGCGGMLMKSCLKALAESPSVWENAPEWAIGAKIVFTGNGISDGYGTAEYHRPKNKTEKERVIDEVKEAIGKLSEDGVISISVEDHARNGITETTIKILR